MWSVSRYEIILSIVEKLTATEAKHLSGLATKLLDAHKEHYPKDLGFVVDNQVFGDYSNGVSRHSLWFELMPEGRKLKSATEALEQDMEYLKQAFSVLFRKCKTLQDMRDAVPDALIPYCSPAFTKFKRTREEGWCMTDDDRQIEKFKKLKAKIFEHVANRMLY